MSVRLIARLEIHDRDRCAGYGKRFMEVFSRYEGKLLSVGESPELLEGERRVAALVQTQIVARPPRHPGPAGC
ncbi:MAG TPA: DUF1330 domain-containing protein [Pseudomonadales bacterium]